MFILIVALYMNLRGMWPHEQLLPINVQSVLDNFLRPLPLLYVSCINIDKTQLMYFIWMVPIFG